MSKRRYTRIGVAVAAGVGLGFLSPVLPVFGQTTPAERCQAALVGAQSQILSAQSRVAGLPSVPVGVQSQLVGARSRLVAINSQVCQSLPSVPPSP